MFAILSTADQAMKGSVAVGGDLKRRRGVLGCVCVRALFAGELLGFAVQEIEIVVRTRRAARALRNTRVRVEMATAPRSWMPPTMQKWEVAPFNLDHEAIAHRMEVCRLGVHLLSLDRPIAHPCRVRPKRT